MESGKNIKPLNYIAFKRTIDVSKRDQINNPDCKDAIETLKITVVDGTPYYQCTPDDKYTPNVWLPFSMIKGSKPLPKGNNLTDGLSESFVYRHDKTSFGGALREQPDSIKHDDSEELKTYYNFSTSKHNHATYSIISKKSLITAHRLTIGSKCNANMLMISYAPLNSEEKRAKDIPLLFNNKEEATVTNPDSVNDWLISQGARFVTNALVPSGLHTMAWKDVRPKLTIDIAASISTATREARTSIEPAHSDHMDAKQTTMELAEYWDKLSPNERHNLLRDYKKDEEIVNEQASRAEQCPFKVINKYSMGNHALNVFVKEFQIAIIELNRKNDTAKTKASNIGAMVEDLLLKEAKASGSLDEAVRVLAGACMKGTPLYNQLCKKTGTFGSKIFKESEDNTCFKRIQKAAQVANAAIGSDPENENSKQMTKAGAKASIKPLGTRPAGS